MTRFLLILSLSFLLACSPRGHVTLDPQAASVGQVEKIFIGTTHVGGCDELYALDRAGKLDALLTGDKAQS